LQKTNNLIKALYKAPLKKLAPFSMQNSIARLCKLMLVTNKKDLPLDAYLDFISICAKSGVTSIQLREKSLDFDDLFQFGRQLQSILAPLSIPLIVNDSVELAYALNADGVHLGQTDGCALDARRILGDGKIIGLSIDTLAQLDIANTLPINYVGVGTIFPTNNKTDTGTVWGCEGLKKAALASKHPIIAIGGIDETNAIHVIQTGASGIAAIGAFHNALDPAATTSRLRRITRRA
jgi:thiamine-phosphate pyrophosphorylase